MLEFPLPSEESTSKYDFSIRLKTSDPGLTFEGLLESSDYQSGDICVPGAVAVVHLKDITIRLLFNPVPSKRNIEAKDEKLTNENMLFDEAEGEDGDIMLDALPIQKDFEDHALDYTKSAHSIHPPSSGWSEGLLPEIDDNDMIDHNLLLYNTNQASMPSLTSQSSAETDLTGVSQVSKALLGQQVSQTTAITYRKAIQKLIDVGLRTIIGGQQTRSVKEVKLGKPRPDFSLSEIIPSMWSPGFSSVRISHNHRLLYLFSKQFISQRLRFLPSIASALSAHLLRYSLSPTIHKKLAVIEHEQRLVLKHDLEHQLDSRDQTVLVAMSKYGICQIMEARLFSLMQTLLYDERSARRLNSTPCIIERQRPGEEQDIMMDDEGIEQNVLVQKELRSRGDDEFVAISDEEISDQGGLDYHMNEIFNQIENAIQDNEEFYPLLQDLHLYENPAAKERRPSFEGNIQSEEMIEDMERGGEDEVEINDAMNDMSMLDESGAQSYCIRNMSDGMILDDTKNEKNTLVGDGRDDECAFGSDTLRYNEDMLV
jgi:hypothetical protein